MTTLQFIFYVFSALAITSALFVVIAQHPVYSALSLVLTFFSVASIWMMLNAEFLSLVLLLVYVGAVMTLFLFVVMMLHATRTTHPFSVRTGLYWLFCSVLTLSIVSFLGVAFCQFKWPAAHLPVSFFWDRAPSLSELGIKLFTDYAYPCEIAGVLLLLAMVAAIALSHRPPRQRKKQSPDHQVMTRPHDRLRMMK